MEGNSVNPVNLNTSKHPFAELINLAGKGGISPELADKLSQFLVPIIYGKLNSKAKMGHQVEKKNPEEFKLAIKKYVSEYLNKNKKLPPHLKLSKLIKNSFKKNNQTKKLVFEVLNESLKGKKEPKNPLQKEKGSPLKDKVKSQIHKNNEKAEQFIKNLPQKNILPKISKEKVSSDKKVLEEKVLKEKEKTARPREKSLTNTTNTFRNILRKFGKMLFFSPKPSTNTKEKPLEKHLEKGKVTNILNNPKSTLPPNMKYSTAVFLKFFSQIKETLKAINNNPKTALNQTSTQAKAPSPLSAIIVPFWKRHKIIDSYSVKERRKVQRKGECTDESGEDGPDYHHPEDDN